MATQKLETCAAGIWECPRLLGLAPGEAKGQDGDKGSEEELRFAAALAAAHPYLRGVFVWMARKGQWWWQLRLRRTVQGMTVLLSGGSAAGWRRSAARS